MRERLVCRSPNSNGEQVEYLTCVLTAQRGEEKEFPGPNAKEVEIDLVEFGVGISV